MARLQLFLSTVSVEFRNYREVLRHNLNLPDVTIQIQEDFIAGGVPTLDKLDLYIRQCDAVIHLVGGWVRVTGETPLFRLSRQKKVSLPLVYFEMQLKA
jgi:hypothetical protein